MQPLQQVHVVAQQPVRNIQPQGKQSKSLPPVVQYGESGLKVEVKGLKKEENAKTDAHTPLLPPIQASTTNTPTEHSPEKLEQPSTKTKRLDTPTSTTLRQQDKSPERSETVFSPIKVTIVSVGEGKHDEGQSRNRLSKRKTSGKLSHGWSPPQAIQPVTGSAFNTTVKQTQLSSDQQETSTTTEQYSEPTRSMLIEVDVNEFLED